MSKILNKDLKEGFSKIKVSKKVQKTVLKKFCHELMVDILQGHAITLPTPDITFAVYKRDRTKKDPLPRNRKTGKIVHTPGRLAHIYNIDVRLNRTDENLYIFNASNKLKGALNKILKQTNIEYPYSPWQLTDL